MKLKENSLKNRENPLQPWSFFSKVICYCLKVEWDDLIRRKLVCITAIFYMPFAVNFEIIVGHLFFCWSTVPQLKNQISFRNHETSKTHLFCTLLQLLVIMGELSLSAASGTCRPTFNWSWRCVLPLDSLSRFFCYRTVYWTEPRSF